MALTTQQEAHIVVVGGFRSALKNSKANATTQAIENSRQIVRQYRDLEKRISVNPTVHEETYGDGTPGTLAEALASEIAEAKAKVDALLSVTDKTRAQLEAEIQ